MGSGDELGEGQVRPEFSLLDPLGDLSGLGESLGIESNVPICRVDIIVLDFHKVVVRLE